MARFILCLVPLLAAASVIAANVPDAGPTNLGYAALKCSTDHHDHCVVQRCYDESLPGSNLSRFEEYYVWRIIKEVLRRASYPLPIPEDVVHHIKDRITMSHVIRHKEQAIQVVDDMAACVNRHVPTTTPPPTTTTTEPTTTTTEPTTTTTEPTTTTTEPTTTTTEPTTTTTEPTTTTTAPTTTTTAPTTTTTAPTTTTTAPTTTTTKPPTASTDLPKIG